MAWLGGDLRLGKFTLGFSRILNWPSRVAADRSGLYITAFPLFRPFNPPLFTGVATFETQSPPWETWDAGHLAKPRLKAVAGGAMAGWAALSPVSSRCVYAGVAEVSIYVAGAYRGRGVGVRLLTDLVRASEDCGLWTLQAGFFAANTPSIRLHAACGFRVVGTRERLGKLGDTWRDVVLMERRSPRIG